MKYFDPTGHCEEAGDESCWAVYDRVWILIHNHADIFLKEGSPWLESEHWERLGGRSEGELAGILTMLEDSIRYNAYYNSPEGQMAYQILRWQSGWLSSNNYQITAMDILLTPDQATKLRDALSKDLNLAEGVDKAANTADILGADDLIALLLPEVALTTAQIDFAGSDYSKIIGSLGIQGVHPYLGMK